MTSSQDPPPLPALAPCSRLSPVRDLVLPLRLSPQAGSPLPALAPCSRLSPVRLLRFPSSCHLLGKLQRSVDYREAEQCRSLRRRSSPHRRLGLGMGQTAVWLVSRPTASDLTVSTGAQYTFHCNPSHWPSPSHTYRSTHSPSPNCRLSSRRALSPVMPMPMTGSVDLRRRDLIDD